jgi:hypothetical protein
MAESSQGGFRIPHQSSMSNVALFLVRRQTSLTGKAKCLSTIPFEREAEESRNFKLRMIERFKTKAPMTKDTMAQTQEEYVL